MPGSARRWLEEQGYTDGSIEELRDIGNDEVNALLQHVQNSGEGSEVDRVRAAVCGVRFVHSGQLRRRGFFSFFGGGKLKWSCCQSGDVDVMWCSEEEEAARKKAAVAAKMNLSVDEIVSCLCFEILLHRSNNNIQKKKC